MRLFQSATCVEIFYLGLGHKVRYYRIPAIEDQLCMYEINWTANSAYLNLIEYIWDVSGGIFRPNYIP